MLERLGLASEAPYLLVSIGTGTSALRVEGDWRRIYELLSPDRLAGKLRDPLRWAGEVWDLNADRQRAIVTLRALLQEMNDGVEVLEPS